MSLADYSDLLVQVSEYTGRDDFVQMFPRAVSFAESKLNQRLRVSGMEVVVEMLTDTEGSATLPADYLEMREVLNADGKPLDLSTPRALDDYYRNLAATPTGYMIIGGTFFAIPKASASFTLTYYGKITPLTSSITTYDEAHVATTVSGTNWLLLDAPLIYLYACSAEVLNWAYSNGRESDLNKIARMNDMRDAEIAAYQRLDSAKRYSNAKMMMGGVNP